MALIFIVLVIIFIFVRMSERHKEYTKTEPLKKKMGLKTNARLEQSLFEKYLEKDTYERDEIHPALEEAHRKSQEEISRRGFIPCVPLDAYNTKYKWAIKPDMYTKEDLAYVSDIDKCDSYYVRERRKRITERFGKCSDSVLYEEYNVGEPSVGSRSYDAEMKRCTVANSIRHKPGDYITCTYGLCKVIDIKYNNNSTQAHYVLEVCNPNAWLRQVEIPVTTATCSVDQRTLH